MEATVAEPVARKAGRELSFDWRPSGCPEFKWALVVTETETFKRRADRVTETRYAVDAAGGGVFLFAKMPGEVCERDDEVYEAWVGDGTHACTCKGSSCRSHSIECRHIRAIKAGTERGDI